MKRLHSLSYKTLFAILFFTLAGIVFFIKIGSKTEKVSAAWWDDMWHYRKAISIDNSSGSDLTDFQVALSIGTSQLIADGKMQSTCNDIRVTDINGNLLPYWIDPDLGCNTITDTIIYTKFSSLVSGDNTAYVYYGNPSANSVQDGASVYPQLFDTFDGTNLNSNKYKYGGGGTFTQNNYISINNNNVAWDNYLYNNTTYTRDSSMVFYSKLKCDANSYTMIGWHDNSAGVSYTDLVYAIYFSSGNLMVWEDGTNRGSFGTLTNGTWYDIKIELKSTGAKYYYKAINTPTWTLIYDSSYSSESNLRPGIAVYNTNYSYIDDWRIGKYISTEPTVTPQSEETGGGPIAYWKFDEGSGTTAYDSMGLSNGAITNATYTSEDQCISGKCLYFNGSAYINTNYGLGRDISINPITVSMWVKPTSAGAYMFLSPNQGTNQRFYFATFNGKWDMGIQNYGWGDNGGGSISVELNKWAHIEIVANGSTIYMYVNGKITKQINYTSFTLPENIRIGTHGNSSSYGWIGYIDEVKFYPYARTAAQIKLDYNSRGSLSGSSVNLGVRSNTAPSLKSSLVAHYKFDEGNGTIAYDSSGNNYSGIMGNGTSSPVWANGKINKSLNYDGNDYVDTQNIPGLNNTFSISLWTKANNYSSTYNPLICRDGNTNNNMILRFDTSGNIEFRQYGGSEIRTNNSFPLDTWIHIVAISDNLNGKIYVNGKLEKEGTFPVSFNDTGNISFGKYSYSPGFYFNGLIDEVKIYNKALTPEEVKQDYNAGSAIQFGSTSQSIGGTTTSLEYCIPGDTSYCASPIAEWKMDEGSGTSITDTSGNNYTSTFVGSPSWVQGKIGKAISFNGTTNGISLSGPTTYAHETMSAWVYIDSSSPSGDILGNCHTNANSQYGFTFYLDGNTLRAKAATNGVTYFYDNITYDVTSQKNKWLYLTMTWDNLGTGTNGCDATAKLYVNGQLVDQDTANFSGGYDCTKPYSYPFSMGGTTTNSLTRTTKVKLDQVKVYNYSRTPAQIAYDYNKGGPVGWWKFDECQGNIAYDWSGIGNTGTINIGSGGSQNSLGTCQVGTSAAWTNGSTGKINSSLNFDGIDDYISIPDNPILNTNTEDFTISFWGKSLNYVTSGGIINKGLYWTNGPGYAFTNISNPQRVYFNTYDGTTQKYINTGIGPTYDWTHFIGLKKGATIEVWINGKYLTSNSAPSNSLSNNSSLILGRGTGGYWDGQIDDVRIYNYALTSEQIKQVYNGGSVSFN